MLCLAILIMSNLYDDSSDDDSFQGQVLIFRQCSPAGSALMCAWRLWETHPSPPRAAPGPPGNSRRRDGEGQSGAFAAFYF